MASTPTGNVDPAEIALARWGSKPDLARVNARIAVVIDECSRKHAAAFKVPADAVAKGVRTRLGLRPGSNDLLRADSLRSALLCAHPDRVLTGLVELFAFDAATDLASARSSRAR